MAVTIGSNISAIRIQRRLADATSSLSNSYERLASGSRINRASDDAAGLSIAMRLRTNTRLASAALRNVSDATSSINIIDGALNNQRQVPGRLAELAEQSASGSFSNVQRGSLNAEYQQLVREFGRIGDSTVFNGLNLLKGAYGSSMDFQIGIDGSARSSLGISLANTGRLSGNVVISSDVTSIGGVPGDGGTPDGMYTHDDVLYLVNVLNSEEITEEELYVIGNNQVAEMTLPDGTTGYLVFSGLDAAENGYGIFFVKQSNGNYSAIQHNPIQIDGSTGVVNWAPGYLSQLPQIDISGLRIHNQLTAAEETHGPVLTRTSLDFTDVASITRARAALDLITAKISEIAALGGRYGALQNRLSTTVEVLQASKENFEAAASRITDTDVAQESADVVRKNILLQAASQLAAQANQEPGLALVLLRN